MQINRDTESRSDHPATTDCQTSRGAMARCYVATIIGIAFVRSELTQFEPIVAAILETALSDQDGIVVAVQRFYRESPSSSTSPLDGLNHHRLKPVGSKLTAEAVFS